MRLRNSALAIVSTIVGVVACSADAPERGAAEAERAVAPEGAVSETDAPVRIVDSIFPIEEEIRRFRAVLGPEPAGLSGGGSSVDALVAHFIRALVRADTAAFANMVMSVDEFGWLYYPHTRFTAPPYELPPGLVWFQIENGSSRGIGRLLQRVAGQPVELLEYACPDEPLVEGPNRLWENCALRVRLPGQAPELVRYFGTIIERGGVFKFVSYTNDF